MKNMCFLVGAYCNTPLLIKQTVHIGARCNVLTREEVLHDNFGLQYNPASYIIQHDNMEEAMNFFKFVLFPIVLLIIAMLGIKEYSTYVSGKARGEETGYFRRRLIRRLVGLGLLTVIVVLISLHNKVSAFLGSAGMSLLYLLGCLALTLVIFVLVIIDLKETGEMVVKKQRDLARDSISSLQQRVRELQKTDAEQQACQGSTAKGGRQTDADTQSEDSRSAS